MLAIGRSSAVTSVLEHSANILLNESRRESWVMVRRETLSLTHIPQKYSMQTQDHRRLLNRRISKRIVKATMVFVLRLARSDHSKKNQLSHAANIVFRKQQLRRTHGRQKQDYSRCPATCSRHLLYISVPNKVWSDCDDERNAHWQKHGAHTGELFNIEHDEHECCDHIQQDASMAQVAKSCTGASFPKIVANSKGSLHENYPIRFGRHVPGCSTPAAPGSFAMGETHAKDCDAQGALPYIHGTNSGRGPTGRPCETDEQCWRVAKQVFPEPLNC